MRQLSRLLPHSPKSLPNVQMHRILQARLLALASLQPSWASLELKTRICSRGSGAQASVVGTVVIMTEFQPMKCTMKGFYRAIKPMSCQYSMGKVRFFRVKSSSSTYRPLEELLIQIYEKWGQIAERRSLMISCPISFSEEEIEQSRQKTDAWAAVKMNSKIYERKSWVRTVGFHMSTRKPCADLKPTKRSSKDFKRTRQGCYGAFCDRYDTSS